MLKYFLVLAFLLSTLLFIFTSTIIKPKLNACYSSINIRYREYLKKLETGSGYNLTKEQREQEIGGIFRDASECPKKVSLETKVPQIIVNQIIRGSILLEFINPYKNSSIIP